jgi:rapamycin-insensitive companion of mTOR
MGAEILEEYGWIATRTPLGRPTGICLPSDISLFAHVRLDCYANETHIG